MKKNKFILLSTLALTLSSSPVVFANSAGSNEFIEPIDTSVFYETSKIEPRVNWMGNAALTAGKWVNIMSSNNIFPDSPLVTNHSGNKGVIEVRILNQHWQQVGSIKSVGTGESVRMDQIPALSGNYTLQGRPLLSGTYTISID